MKRSSITPLIAGAALIAGLAIMGPALAADYGIGEEETHLPVDRMLSPWAPSQRESPVGYFLMKEVPEGTPYNAWTPAWPYQSTVPAWVSSDRPVPDTPAPAGY